MHHIRFYKVTRAPLGMPNAPKVHWGFAVQNIHSGEVLVLHNTPEKNVHLGDLEEFHSGRDWGYEEIPYSDEIYQRFLVAAHNNQRQYDLITNNCQQTYTGIVDGFSWTPVMWLAGIIVVGGIAIYAANRSGGSA